MNQPTRRTFLGTALAATAASSARSEPPAPAPLRVAVMGTGGRGRDHIKTFAGRPNVVVSHVCDVDESRVAKAAKVVEDASMKAPEVVADFRRILDDKAVDVLVVATCNHWHAPAAILACQHGKHVYVEKPCSHNPREGELLVAGRAQAQAAGADGQPAAELRQDPGGGPVRPRGRHRPGLLRPVVVLQPPRRHRQGPGGRAAEGAGLRPVAGAGPGPAVPRKLPPLQLALVLGLGQRRTGQQRRPHDRRLPLGAGRRLPGRA